VSCSQRPDGGDDWLVLRLQEEAASGPGCLALFLLGFLGGLAVLALLAVAAVLVALVLG
jgi:hypothetical protein